MLSKAKQEHRPTDLYSKGTGGLVLSAAEGKGAQAGMPVATYSQLTESNDVQNSPSKLITIYIINLL